jgi:hypothetical protein
MTGTERTAIQQRARDLALELLDTGKLLEDVAHAAEIEDPDLQDELGWLCFRCEECGLWHDDGDCELVIDDEEGDDY